MIYSIDYYTYEYCVLRGLTDIFKEFAISINSDDHIAYNTTRNDLGVLEKKEVARFNGERLIKFHLVNNTDIEINESVIMKEFNNETPIEKSTLIIADLIKTEWLKFILK